MLDAEAGGGTEGRWGLRLQERPHPWIPSLPLPWCGGGRLSRLCKCGASKEKKVSLQLSVPGEPATRRNPAENSSVVANNCHLILVSWALQTLLSLSL